MDLLWDQGCDHDQNLKLIFFIKSVELLNDSVVHGVHKSWQRN